MLVEFRVKKFKNFEEELILKLDKIKNYQYNIEAIKEGVVRVGMIYGKNGSGKTNLGLAILDILNTITDNNDRSKGSFINLSSNEYAQFYYRFKIDTSTVVYKYEKDESQILINEELQIDGINVITYNHRTQEGETFLKGTEQLNTNLNGKHISFVKYIKSNSVLYENKQNVVFKQLMIFIEKMMFINSLDYNNELIEEIIIKGKLHEFDNFLHEFGFHYDLIEKEIDGYKHMYCKFENELVSFNDIASSGIKSLAILFSWLIKFDDSSFVYIDNFDAFFNNKVAKIVLEKILSNGVQVLMTAHNTGLIDNDLLRPDCYFNLVDGKIKSFADMTSKDLRKAHNIEKMYRAGSFDS